jgi:hypothetical protein
MTSGQKINEGLDNGRNSLVDGLYHSDVFLPVPADCFKFGMVPLIYSRHAKFAALDDRYGAINLPPVLNTNTAKLVEIEVKMGRIVKIVYRAEYNTEFDIVFAIAVGGYVKTVWLNMRADTHQSLRMKEYRKQA